MFVRGRYKHNKSDAPTSNDAHTYYNVSSNADNNIEMPSQGISRSSHPTVGVSNSTQYEDVSSGMPNASNRLPGSESQDVLPSGPYQELKQREAVTEQETSYQRLTLS